MGLAEIASEWPCDIYVPSPLDFAIEATKGFFLGFYYSPNLAIRTIDKIKELYLSRIRSSESNFESTD